MCRACNVSGRQPKTLVNDLYRAMCDCYNDHRSHRAKGQDTASSPHGLYNLNAEVLSIGSQRSSTVKLSRLIGLRFVQITVLLGKLCQ
jgi:hypothetical protein